MIPLLLALLVGLAAGAVGGVYWVRRKRAPGADPRVLELSELAGGLAHEIRNPLSTLMVNLQLLGEDLRALEDEAGDTRRRSLLKVEAVRREAERLRHLLDDFLRVAGPCRLELESADLNPCVEELVEFFSPQADAAGVRLHVALSGEPLPSRIDPQLLKQALLNLLINAQEAMPDGGEIMVRTRREPNRAVLEISDTGPGIPPGRQSQVFRPFFSTKARGTGLGLSTTLRIVTEHGGSLNLHSEPGKGSCFTIRLPMDRAGVGPTGGQKK